jgi:hypothetical protein
VSQQSGKTQRQRRNPHAGRSRGSTIKTGNRGARPARLSHADKIATSPYIDQLAAVLKRRSEQGRKP